MVKKVLMWGGLAFILFYIVFGVPGSAANVFKAIGGGIMDIAQGLGEFFTSLVA